MQYNNFNRLIGAWATSGKVFGGPEPQLIMGTDRYEWILEANFILHTADVMMGQIRSETLEIIKPGEEAEKAAMHYFNADGRNGTMYGYIVDDEFRIEGEHLKFEGKFLNEGDALLGNWWQWSTEGKWELFIELQLIKKQE